MYFLNLTLGIRLIEMVLCYSTKMVRSNENKNKIIYSNSMKTNRNELIRRLLSGVTDDELENLVRVREEARRPIPAPRKMEVKQLIRYFENNNLYKPPRPKKQDPRPQPIPAPRTKIMEKSKALKGYTKSYEIAIKNDKDILEQLQNTRLAISRFPYDYMDSFERFNETQLPSKDDFFSQLTQDAITDEQYCHATKVWGTFNLQTMGDYHDLYLKSDILLLADVFENFRSTCLQYYKLDPCHYYTSPGLSWDAMLKMTDIKLELMTDIDMFQFIEKGTRGGISYIANRFGEANNKYMKE